jgi:CheY-like chemotaxis protein
VVVISLAPGLQADSDPPSSLDRTGAKNVIHATGPFSTQTLASILEQADAVVAEIKASELRTSRPSAALPMHLKRTNDHSTSDSDSQPDSSILTPAESSEEETAPTRTQASPRPLRTSPRPTTLIVDDNIVNLRVMEMYCKKRGLPYLTAQDGLQAIEVFTKRQSSSFLLSPPTGNNTGNDNENDLPPIELIFMDLQMPLCDGVEATKQIRSLEQENGWASSLIVVMTGQDTLADKSAAKEAGGDEYFVKPVILQQLDRVVRRQFPAFEVGIKP